MRNDTMEKQYQKDLIRLMIDAEVLRFGEFTLKSGRKAPYFINMGNFNTGGRMARLGSFYADCIAAQWEQGTLTREITTLYGPAYKGIPLAVATSMALYQNYGVEVGYTYHRKEQKEHGEGGTLVGFPLKDGDRILILDDVITAGTALRESLQQIRATAEVKVEGLIIAVDRMERGKGSGTASAELMTEFGIPTYPIITVRHIIQSLLTEQDPGQAARNQELAKRMEDYLATMN